jgi:hypothetical protein
LKTEHALLVAAQHGQTYGSQSLISESYPMIFAELTGAVKDAVDHLLALPVLSLVGVLGAVATVTVALQSVRAWVRLRHFPGPRLATWSRIPMISWHLSGKAHLELGRISETYGEICSWY